MLRVVQGDCEQDICYVASGTDGIVSRLGAG
jgi:hypothetical protein